MNVQRALLGIESIRYQQVMLLSKIIPRYFTSFVQLVVRGSRMVRFVKAVTDVFTSSLIDKSMPWDCMSCTYQKHAIP